MNTTISMVSAHAMDFEMCHTVELLPLIDTEYASTPSMAVLAGYNQIISVMVACVLAVLSMTYSFFSMVFNARKRKEATADRKEAEDINDLLGMFQDDDDEEEPEPFHRLKQWLIALEDQMDDLYTIMSARYTAMAAVVYAAYTRTAMLCRRKMDDLYTTAAAVYAACKRWMAYICSLPSKAYIGTLRLFVPGYDLHFVGISRPSGFEKSSYTLLPNVDAESTMISISTSLFPTDTVCDLKRVIRRTYGLQDEHDVLIVFAHHMVTDNHAQLRHVGITNNSLLTLAICANTDLSAYYPQKVPPPQEASEEDAAPRDVDYGYHDGHPDKEEIDRAVEAIHCMFDTDEDEEPEPTPPPPTYPRLGFDIIMQEEDVLVHAMPVCGHEMNRDSLYQYALSAFSEPKNTHLTCPHSKYSRTDKLCEARWQYKEIVDVLQYVDGEQPPPKDHWLDGAKLELLSARNLIQSAMDVQKCPHCTSLYFRPPQPDRMQLEDIRTKEDIEREFKFECVLCEPGSVQVTVKVPAQDEDDEEEEAVDPHNEDMIVEDIDAAAVNAVFGGNDNSDSDSDDDDLAALVMEARRIRRRRRLRIVAADSSDEESDDDDDDDDDDDVEVNDESVHSAVSVNSVNSSTAGPGLFGGGDVSSSDDSSDDDDEPLVPLRVVPPVPPVPAPPVVPVAAFPGDDSSSDEETDSEYDEPVLPVPDVLAVPVVPEESHPEHEEDDNTEAVTAISHMFDDDGFEFDEEERTKCLNGFCWCCGAEWVDGHVCDSHFKQDLVDILQMAEGKTIGSVSEVPSIRCCPSCCQLILHVEACKHMACSRCGVDFCFVCLKPTINGNWQCGSHCDVCPVAPRQGMDALPDTIVITKKSFQLY